MNSRFGLLFGTRGGNFRLLLCLVLTAIASLLIVAFMVRPGGRLAAPDGVLEAPLAHAQGMNYLYMPLVMKNLFPGWAQVSADGFGDSKNSRLSSLAVFDNYLYAGTYNLSTGTELWRSPDGTTWSQVNTNGFGDPNNRAVFSLAVFDNYLYAGTWNYYPDPPGGGEVWSTPDGTTWFQVNADGFGDPNNRGVYSLAVFDNHLYAGTLNHYTGAEIWRTPE